jgi:hypothetical protein
LSVPITAPERKSLYLLIFFKTRHRKPTIVFIPEGKYLVYKFIINNIVALFDWLNVDCSIIVHVAISYLGKEINV